MEGVCSLLDHYLALGFRILPYHSNWLVLQLASILMDGRLQIVGLDVMRLSKALRMLRCDVLV
jgi:hypothetical protein